MFVSLASLRRCPVRRLAGRFSRGFAVLPVVFAMLCCASCGDAKPRKQTVPVEGKVLWKNDKTPAAGAVVVFRPVGDDKLENWPDGFPRASVGGDGSFELSTYGDGDGAPAGDYAVLITWPRAAASPQQDADPESERGDNADRFEGAYSDPARPRWTKQVAAGANDPKYFVFIIR